MWPARARLPLMPDSLAIFALNETWHLHTAMCFMRIADKARPTKTKRQQQNQADGKLQLANRDNPLHISVCIMHTNEESAAFHSMMIIIIMIIALTQMYIVNVNCTATTTAAPFCPHSQPLLLLLREYFKS